MTEQEAKEKWCPMVRFKIGADDQAWQNKAYTNRAEEFGPDKCVCCASRCMMWRVEHKKEQREGHSGGKELLFTRGFETGREPKQVSYDLWELPATGYCGLGGKL
jgi:hypothetical protein